MLLKLDQPWFIFDVESIGLHGEAFAVAGGVYIGGVAKQEFCFSVNREKCNGQMPDRVWVNKNVPDIAFTHATVGCMRLDFWHLYQVAKKQYPDILIAAECLWPVEANFFTRCAEDDLYERAFGGPYPFHEIASIMLCAGMDPMATYDRTESEKPAHNPLGDARLSARLLHEAVTKINTMFTING